MHDDHDQGFIKFVTPRVLQILIKSIAQAVPTYAMMVFNIPINICKGMTDAISQFWWSDDDDKRRIHWQAWWKLCLPKYKGGMGF